jgi:hypothetical protein
VGAQLIPVGLGAAAKADEAGLLGVGNLPRPAALEPFIGDLDLPAIADQLVEDAEFVANAIPRGRDLERGQRFQEAGRQTAQAAVAQSRFLLHIEEILDVDDAEAADRLCGLLLDAQHQEVVAQLGADQEFGRKVGHNSGRTGRDRLDARQVAGHQPVPN